MRPFDISGAPGLFYFNFLTDITIFPLRRLIWVCIVCQGACLGKLEKKAYILSGTLHWSVSVRYYNMSRDMTKPTKWVCAQRRLRSAWASAQCDPSLRCQHEETLFLATDWAYSEDSDQTGRMPRLIWVFAGRTLILLVLICRGSYYNIEIPLIRVHGHFQIKLKRKEIGKVMEAYEYFVITAVRLDDQKTIGYGRKNTSPFAKTLFTGSFRQCHPPHTLYKTR